MAQFQRYLPLLLAIRPPLHWLFGIHCWSFRLSGPRGAAGGAHVRHGLRLLRHRAFFLQREAPARRRPAALGHRYRVLRHHQPAGARFARLAQTFPLHKIRSRSGERVRVVVGAGSAES
jgi:hypothetical protein